MKYIYIIIIFSMLLFSNEHFEKNTKEEIISSVLEKYNTKINKQNIDEQNKEQLLKVQKFRLEMIVNTIFEINNLSVKNEFKKLLIENDINNALKQFKNLSRKHPNKYLKYYASVIYNDGISFYWLNDDSQAYKNFMTSLQIRIKLPHTKENRSDLADNYFSLGLLYKRQNKIEIARKKYKESIKIRKILIIKSPNNFNLSRLADITHELAEINFKNDLDLSIKQYHKVIEIRRGLVKNDKTYNVQLLADSLNNLAVLNKKLGNFQQSINLYKEAYSIYKNKNDGRNLMFFSYMSNTLINLANVYKETEKNDLAITEYNKALKIKELLYKENEKIFGIDFARALIIGYNQSFNKSIESLNDAEKILKNYKNNAKAKRLIKFIDTLKNRNNH